MLIATAVMLVGLGAWTYNAIEGSLREIRASTLNAELEAEARALRNAPNAEASVRALREIAIGERGELIAIDRHGVLLSESRLAPELKGRVLQSRMTESIAAGAGAEDAAGRQGTVLEPYPNHRGEEVIGAWRWIPEHRLALAAEIPAAQAYAPLHYLRIAFGAVFGALVIAVAAALWSTLSVLRLRELVGRKLGAYRLERQIGEGGMANIYLARHDLLKRPCAVKLLKPARANDEMIARFAREVQLASALSHPNVVEIYDYGHTSQGLFYYAMEYLEGINLGELVAREGPVPVSRAVRLLRQLCAGLAAAHAAGLVHRDVKPENVMVCQRGEETDVVKILDFGMVKKADAGHSRNLTRGLRILGTPLYMAPERLQNPADADARADIYAVGAVAYYMLTGKKMFESADDLGLSSRILNEEPPRVSLVAAQPVPVELDLLIQSCLEKQRENRPQRVTDLLEAFDALISDSR